MSKKYKHLTKIQDLKNIPSRVLKFKRSKWSKLKNILVKNNPILTKNTSSVEATVSQQVNTFVRAPLGSNIDSHKFLSENSFNLPFKPKLKIFDKFKIFANKGRFLFLSNLSKDKVQSKLKLRYLLNQPSLITKQKCKDKDFYIKNIYQNSFCISGILCSYYFFTRFTEIKNKFKEGSILRNNKKHAYYGTLKRGDIIKVNGKVLDLKKNMKSSVSNYMLPSHIEGDIYSQTIVLIKDSSMTSQEDYHLLSSEYINFQKI